MKNKILIFIILPVLIITGCNKKEKKIIETNTTLKKEIKEVKKEPKENKFHTVNYYIKHPEIRKKRIEECKNLDTMDMNILIDCDSANDAEFRKSLKKLY